MSGTVAGGRKAAATNKEKYGDGFYAEIGTKGGRAGHTGGFRSEKVGKDGLTGFERARIAGAKGGRISKRGPAKSKGRMSKPKHKPIPQEAIDAFNAIADCSTFAITHLSYDMKKGDHTHTMMSFPTALEKKYRLPVVLAMIAGTIRDASNQLGQDPAQMAKAIAATLQAIPNTDLIWEREICLK